MMLLSSSNRAPPHSDDTCRSDPPVALALMPFLSQLTCRYFRTRSYFEMDIDIGSSVVAFNTVSLAIGYAKSLVVDMAFCVQVGANLCGL